MMAGSARSKGAASGKSDTPGRFKHAEIDCKDDRNSPAEETRGKEGHDDHFRTAEDAGVHRKKAAA
jgi:hypothetical protein